MNSFSCAKLLSRSGHLWLVASLSILATGCGTIVQHVMMGNPKVQAFLDDTPIDRTLNHYGRVETIGEDDHAITVLYVSGSPYEMGFEHGRLLGAQVRETCRDVLAGADKFLPNAVRKSFFLTAGDKRSIVNKLLDKGWNKMAPFTPREDLEEMAGLAAGSGLPLEVIHRLHAIPDLGETSCSALIAKGSATRDQHTYQLRILDYGANFNLQKRPLITVYKPSEGRSFVNVGWIGFIGVVSGVNDAGVALSEMGFGDPPGETLAGTPMPFLLKNVLRHANDADAGASIIRLARRTNSYVYFLGDASDNAVGMITSARECMSFRANENELVTFEGKEYPQYKDIVYAGHYQQKQAGLINKLHGSFDLETIKGLASDIAMPSNLHTVIYDLTDSKIWVANRKDDTRAADRPYVPFSLRDVWPKPANVASSAATQPEEPQRVVAADAPAAAAANP